MCCSDRRSLAFRSGRLAVGEGRCVAQAPLVPAPRTRGRRRADRRGQSLVEFAFVALVVYLLLAAILTFGQILYCGQAVQQAADVAARELSRTPLPAEATFQDALQDPLVTARVFDERYLVLTIDPGSNPITFNGGHPLADFPLVNQQLVPVMIYDEIGGVRVLRYPGAVFSDPSPNQGLSPRPSGYLVRVPVVTVPTYPAPATEQIAWVPVLEGISSPANLDPFPVSSVQRGLVALRINYPYQSATMSGFQRVPDPGLAPGPGNPVNPVEAGSVLSGGTPPGVGSPVASDFEFGPYSGDYSLGQQAAWAQTVRPYRRVISAQAIFRREVFQ